MTPYKDITFFPCTVVINVATVPNKPAAITIIAITVHPASLQAFRLLQTRVCEQLPVPKSKRGAEGSLELDPDGVND